jgi:protein TonB
MTPEQFKDEVARRLDEQVKKLEADQKAKAARAEAKSRAASLRPTPAAISPSVSTPKPIVIPTLPAPVTPSPRPAPAQPAAAAPPAVKRGDLVALTEVDRAPEIASVVKPEYPPVARRMNVSGTVVLSVLVDETGRVEDVRTIREAGGNMGLTQAAQKAVRLWTFRPAVKGGVNVKTWMTIPIPFVL